MVSNKDLTSKFKQYKIYKKRYNQQSEERTFIVEKYSPKLVQGQQKLLTD